MVMVMVLVDLLITIIGEDYYSDGDLGYDNAGCDDDDDWMSVCV